MGVFNNFLNFIVNFWFETCTLIGELTSSNIKKTACDSRKLRHNGFSKIRLLVVLSWNRENSFGNCSLRNWQLMSENCNFFKKNPSWWIGLMGPNKFDWRVHNIFDTEVCIIVVYLYLKAIRICWRHTRLVTNLTFLIIKVKSYSEVNNCQIL